MASWRKTMFVCSECGLEEKVTHFYETPEGWYMVAFEPTRAERLAHREDRTARKEKGEEVDEWGDEWDDAHRWYFHNKECLKAWTTKPES